MILKSLSIPLLSRNQLACENVPKGKSMTKNSVTTGQLQKGVNT